MAAPDSGQGLPVAAGPSAEDARVPGRAAAGLHRVRPYRVEDEATVVDLLARTLPRWAGYADPPAVWRWKHMANPFGASSSLVALHGERVVGTTTFMRWTLRRGEELYPAVRSVDLATEPALQGTGVASELARKAFLLLKELGVPLGFYTPNQNSARLAQRDGRHLAGVLEPTLQFRRKLPLLRAWWRARRGAGPPPGGEARQAFRAPPTPVAEWLRQEREPIEDLLAHDRARDPARFRTAHTWDSLRWRYAAHPELRYHVVCARRPGQLAGALIYRVEDYHSARRLVLEDLWLRGSDAAPLRALRGELEDVVAADLVQAHLPDASAGLLLGGRTRRTGRGYTLVIRVMDPALGESPFRRESWSLTLGDLREI